MADLEILRQKLLLFEQSKGWKFTLTTGLVDEVEGVDYDNNLVYGKEYGGFHVSLCELYKAPQKNGLSKKEAIEALRSGEKIRHRFFTPREYIFQRNECIIDENGFFLASFWQYRSSIDWEDGWEVIGK